MQSAKAVQVLVALLLGVGAMTQSLRATGAALPVANPFSRPSTLAFQLPPFDRIKNSDFAPALDAGMAAQRMEVDAIAGNPQPATFENTIVVMERSGALLTRVTAVFANLTASHTNAELDRVQTEMAPKLAAHSDAIFLNPVLFARVHALYEHRDALGLDPESLRLLERYNTRFLRAGAQLAASGQARLKQMNERLSTLTTQFKQKVLKGVNDSAIVVENVTELEGLPAEQIAVAAEAAKARGLPGKWVIALLNTTGQPALSQLKNRALRERIFRASVSRGVSGGPNDTTELVAEIVRTRAERAALLGYPNHATYVLEDETARSPQAALNILSKLAPPALTNAKREAADIQLAIDAQAKASGTQSFMLQPWDWDFYAEQVRKAKYSFDESEVRPYFELNHVLRDGVFYAAHELYGLSFKERTVLPVYQKDVRVFEVIDRDGSPLGLFLVDWFARPSKRGGAWMNSFVEQSRLLGSQPVVVNNLNIPKPPEGKPALLTFDEVTTAFHEFGHALHGLFSDVRYPLFSGTSVPRDFVEYPSQYNEMWATNPAVLASYAKHYQTGMPMPPALVEKVLAARQFNQGYATLEYLEAAMLDLSYHQLAAGATPEATQVAEFEAAALKSAGVDFYAVPPRYRSTYFSHIFTSSIGYSAGYYAYLWSEVLARDTEQWFKTHGGLERANGDYLRAKVLSKGFSVDPLVLFRNFYGGPPQIEPLLEKRGLLIEPQQSAAP